MRRPKIEMAYWHVVMRGARRLILFHDDQDYWTFLRDLRKGLAKSGVTLIAYCLMSNHVHLVLQGSSGQISRCMKATNQAYSRYHNRRYNLSGHTFEQTYFARAFLDPFRLQRTLRYVHLNPVRAGLTARPEAYPWSNCRDFLSRKTDYLGSDIEGTLKPFGRTISAARKAYHDFLYEDLSRPVRVSPHGTPASELWQEEFRWILECTTSNAKQLSPLDPADVAVYLAVRSGIPPRFVAKVLGNTNGRCISSAAYRLSQKLAEDAELMSRVAALGLA